MTFKSIAVNAGSSNFHPTKTLGLILKGKWVMLSWIFLVMLIYSSHSKVQHTKESVPWEYPWLRLLLRLMFCWQDSNIVLVLDVKILGNTAEKFNTWSFTALPDTHALSLLRHKRNCFFPSFSCPSQDTIDLLLTLTRDHQYKTEKGLIVSDSLR